MIRNATFNSIYDVSNLVSCWLNMPPSGEETKQTEQMN